MKLGNFICKPRRSTVIMSFHDGKILVKYCFCLSVIGGLYKFYLFSIINYANAIDFEELVYHVSKIKRAFFKLYSVKADVIPNGNLPTLCNY